LCPAPCRPLPWHRRQVFPRLGSGRCFPESRLPTSGELALLGTNKHGSSAKQPVRHPIPLPLIKRRIQSLGGFS
jgi:hypothetical protein